MMRTTFLVVLILASAGLKGQILDWHTFKQQVLHSHPMAAEAELFSQQARLNIQQARGGFDPKAYGEYLSKNFQDKTYFRFLESGVKWPSWAGLELKLNYNLASGYYLNPENVLPEGGQAGLGFEWALGQGLWTDERRTALRQAKIGLVLGESQRLLALNDLLLEASKAYWNWVYAGFAADIANQALQQANTRHLGLIENFRQGDKPAVDTLETYIQLQTRMLEWRFALADSTEAALAMSGFWWLDRQTPGALPHGVQPPTIEYLKDAVQWSDTVTVVHPALQGYSAKLEQLRLEKQFKKEKKKPVVNLSYQLLGNNWQFFPSVGANGPEVLARDAKVGLTVQYPILNRKSSADYQLTQLKIIQTELGMKQKSQEIAVKSGQYQVEAQNLKAQMQFYEALVEKYRLLLDAEQEKFKQGESTIFLINSREQKYLDARLKSLKLMVEYQKARAGYWWSRGLLTTS